eukprot:GHVR01139765.1.p1 GENE.GHVR01139765.1~~GHVR01139765.1.p1  ORF type:complete len:211 (-),score=67.25 GHVR01139765.1:34-666(-)
MTTKISSILIPTFIDFGLCAVKEETKAEIKVYNKGKTPATFVWRTEPPYSIQPTCGTILKGCEAKCIASFSPQRAEVFDGVLYCDIDLVDGQLQAEAALKQINQLPDGLIEPFITRGGGLRRPYKMTCTGIAKYPHLQIDNTDSSTELAEFIMGEVVAGVPVERNITIRNLSPVPCTFTVNVEVTPPEAPPPPPPPPPPQPPCGPKHGKI